ncbi:MAG: hypothetical protein KDC46_02955, partial [Thermoleophilia bacterium]|nr:hypothetical protein [Thermoleophilia bacterium]
ECPLQDQAFRWGPGTTRFSEQKRVNDKPIPVSPLIALDRERCILCYRCSRYSAEVTEDLQLIARQRGANSVIATFEGRPWEGHHAGNVIELCPVGALTSTQYRFHGRPWDTTDHPSISPWDVLGSNVYNTVREGRVARVLSRRNDAVDVGWIDDRTRFAYASMYGPARILAPQQRPFRERPIGNRPVVEPSHEVAMEWLHDKLAADGAAPALWVLSGSETLEVVHAVQQLAAATGGRVVAIPGASEAAPAGATPIATIDTAQEIVVIGHADLLDTAPGLDLRIRKARQRGANVTTIGTGATRLSAVAGSNVHAGPGQLDAEVDVLLEHVAKVDPEATLEAVVVVRDGELSDAALERLHATMRFPRERAGLISIPHAPNARGLAALDVPVAEWDEILAHTGGVVYMGVDPDRHVDRAQWGPSIKRAAWVVAVDSLPTPLHDAADLVVPAAWGGEQEGTLVNLEGRLQRMTVGAETPGQVVPQLRWIAGLARRLGAKVPGHAAGTFRQLAAAAGERLPATTHGEIPLDGLLGVHGGPVATHRPEQAPQLAAGQLALYVAPNLFDAAEVAHTDAMSFLTATTTVHLNRAEARAAGLSRGATVRVELDDDRAFDAVVATTTRIAAGHARVAAGTGSLPAGHTGWHAARITPLATEPVAAAATPTGAVEEEQA